MFFLSDEMPFSFDELLLFGAASGGKAIEDTATGNPLVFLTDLARPLKSLLIPFTPKQTGSGDPSPENVRPITGWTGVNVNHAGANLFNKTGAVKYKRYLSGTENRWIYSDDSASVAIPAEPNTTYHIYTVGMAPAILRANSTDNETLPTGSSPVGVACEKARGESTTGELSFTTGNGTKWLLIQFSSNLYDEITNVLVVTDETPSVYPVTWLSEGTVYGGYVDMVTGEVWARWLESKLSDLELSYTTYNDANAFRTKALTGIAKTWSNLDFFLSSCFAKSSTISSYAESASKENNTVYLIYSENRLFIKATDYTTVTDFLAEYGDQTIAYKLATPVLITTLTPQQINAIKGNNTIWSDADGSMTAVYFKKA